MTHLSLPRLHFQGSYKANPPTANNDDIVALIDDTVPDILNPKHLTDAELKQWLMQTTPFGGHVQVNAGWNYFGDGSTAFENTVVTSYQLQQGGLQEPAAREPLAGASVAIVGNQFGDFAFATMADLDPLGSYSTQLFAGKFQVASAAGRPLLWGWASVAHSRWVTQWRNLCFTLAPTACIWQFVLPNGSWQIDETAVSAPLTQLATAAAGAKGLAVRFAVYTLFPRIGNAELAKRFANNEFVANPAYGGLAGTIGLWEADEPQTLPAGRQLRPANRLTVRVNCQTGTQDKQPYKGVRQVAAAVGETAVTFPLGAALVNIDAERRKIVLDLLATFPEINPRHHKVDVGSVSLFLDSGGDRQRLGGVAYDQATYERSAGVVELDWPAGMTLDELRAGDFVLARDGDPATPLVAEHNDYLIVTDTRALYTEVGETVVVELAVYWRGELAKEAVVLTLAQYQNELLSPGTLQNPAPVKQFVRLEGAQLLLTMPPTVTVPPGGRLTLRLQAVRPGIAMVLFLLAETAVPAPADIDHTYAAYSNIRVFPQDNYDDVPDEALTWPFIYRHVFRYFYLLYPAMSIQGFPLNVEEEITRRAPIIKTMVSAALAESSVAMPITRDLSPGKRVLLLRWCELNS